MEREYPALEADGRGCESWAHTSLRLLRGVGGLPCDGQTTSVVADWMQSNAATGTVVVVRHKHFDICEYFLDEVRRCDRRLKRVYLTDHGPFRFTGDCLAPPRGRFGLLAPLGAVMHAATAGQGWVNRRLTFQRPLSAREQRLVVLAHRQWTERSRR